MNRGWSNGIVFPDLPQEHDRILPGVHVVPFPHAYEPKSLLPIQGKRRLIARPNLEVDPASSGMRTPSNALPEKGAADPPAARVRPHRDVQQVGILPDGPADRIAGHRFPRILDRHDDVGEGPPDLLLEKRAGPRGRKGHLFDGHHAIEVPGRQVPDPEPQVISPLTSGSESRPT